MQDMVCPCRTLTEPTLAYNECCQPLHNKQRSANSAEQLMRSRYSAFVLALTDYIIDTTLPAQQNLMDKLSIETWAKQTHWAGLEVVKQSPKVDKRHAQVEFKAFFDTAAGREAHHELSTFITIKEGGEQHWYFLDPTVQMTVTQKQACICGSSVKFKRCCGQFLST